MVSLHHDSTCKGDIRLVRYAGGDGGNGFGRPSRGCNGVGPGASSAALRLRASRAQHEDDGDTHSRGSSRDSQNDDRACKGQAVVPFSGRGHPRLSILAAAPAAPSAVAGVRAGAGTATVERMPQPRYYAGRRSVLDDMAMGMPVGMGGRGAGTANTITPQGNEVKHGLFQLDNLRNI
jgi:hypothetical protein